MRIDINVYSFVYHLHALNTFDATHASKCWLLLHPSTIIFFNSTISKFLKQTLNNQPLASSSTLDGFFQFHTLCGNIKKSTFTKKKHWIAMAYKKLKVVNKKCEWCYFQKYPKAIIKQNKSIKK